MRPIGNRDVSRPTQGSPQVWLPLASAQLTLDPDPVSSSALDARGRGCTTEQSNTHITDTLEVRYPWHPWYGHQLRVKVVRIRNGPVVFRCTKDDEQECLTLELPQWMFDTSSCQRMKISGTARVDCEALRALRTLIDLSTHLPEPLVLEDQHQSLIPGGADEKAIEAESRPDEAVPGATRSSGTAPGGKAEDDETAGANAEGARNKGPRLKRQGGGQ